MTQTAKEIVEESVSKLRGAGEGTLADMLAALASVEAVKYCAKSRSATVAISLQNGRVTYVKPEFSFKAGLDFLTE